MVRALPLGRAGQRREANITQIIYLCSASHGVNQMQRKTIFLSCHIGKIRGWIRPDSMCFIDDLIEYATQSRFKYVHEWSQHDLVIWDNRQTMHRARAFDDLKENRDMRRTTVLGEEKLL